MAHVTPPSTLDMYAAQGNSSFFGKLPRELRDQIYCEYLYLEGGYVFNSQLGKMRTADDQPVDLRLMRGCRAFAAEMRGLALGTNLITFTTMYLAEDGILAARFHNLMDELREEKKCMIENAAVCINSGTAESLDTCYPQFSPLTHWLVSQTIDDSAQCLPYWGEAPSTRSRYFDAILNSIYTHPEFEERSRRYGFKGKDCNTVALLKEKPWVIPTEEGVNEMSDLLNCWPVYTTHYTRDFWRREKFRYSAAAVAIRWLASTSGQKRDSIRRIILHEDHIAVGLAECHAQGLIPFCQENPHLRIERRLSLWKNVLAGSSPLKELERHPDYPVEWKSQDRTSGFLSRMPISSYGGELRANHIADSISLYMIEASVLPSLGMPKNSFSLVFDGEGIPEQSSEIFGFVHETVAWHRALDECYDRGILPKPSWFDRRAQRCYLYEKLPQILEGMVKAQQQKYALIRCDFGIGELWDVERVIQANRGLSSDEWYQRWKDLGKRKFEMMPPLPRWFDVRMENVLAEPMFDSGLRARPTI